MHLHVLLCWSGTCLYLPPLHRRICWRVTGLWHSYAGPLHGRQRYLSDIYVLRTYCLNRIRNLSIVCNTITTYSRCIRRKNITHCRLSPRNSSHAPKHAPALCVCSRVTLSKTVCTIHIMATLVDKPFCFPCQSRRIQTTSLSLPPLHFMI